MIWLTISILAMIFAIGATVLVYLTATAKSTMDLLAKQSNDKALEAVRKWRAKHQ